MNKKLVIIAVVLIVVLGGGILLWQQQPRLRQGFGGQEKKQYSATPITPTKWSQAGDYRITETPEGTVVENQKAGFSFRVPGGWRIEEKQYGLGREEYILNFLSSDAEFDESDSLIKGCGISLQTLHDRLEVDSVKNRLAFVEEKEGQISSEDVTQLVLKINGNPALKTTSTTDPRFLEKFGRITQVRIPTDDITLILIGSSIMPIAQQDCDSKFEKFLASFLLK